MARDSSGNNGNYWTKRSRFALSRRRFLAGTGVAAAGSAALLAAGCGDDDDDDGDDAVDPTATSAPGATEAPQATEAPEPTATTDPRAGKEGGTLQLWKGVEDAGMDPAVFHLNNTTEIYGQMTQPYTYQPTKNEFAADGMVSWEQPDSTTFIWHVRPDMKFHNGDPVDAEAVAFSFNRLAPLYDARGGTHVTRTGFVFVDAFSAVDDLTVREDWSRPNADAPTYRARHYYSFVNPRIVEEHGIDGEIQDLPPGSGSGPYTLTQRDAEGTRLERWPDYHKHSPAGDGFVEDGPYIDNIETRIIPDRAAAKAAFLAGDLDVFTALDALEVAEFEGDDNATVTPLPAGGWAFEGMDGGHFYDVRARQALQKAFKYDEFIAAFRTGGGKLGSPMSALISGLQGLGQEDLKKWFTYDPTTARQLWDAAENTPDKIVILTQTGDPLLTDIHDFMAQSLSEALGVDTEVDALDTNSWAARAIDRTDGGFGKDWHLLGYGTGIAGGTSGVPNDSHLIHFDPRAYGLNAFNFYLDSPRPSIAEGSETLVAMLNAQEAETDQEARKVLMTELQTWVLDNHWCNWTLPIASDSFYGFGSRLRDHGANDWLNYYSMRRESMWLDQNA